MSKGKVYLVGAGPGDPGLITVKGAELLKRADVVVYDFLAEDSLLSLCKRDAEFIYVGKRGGHHTLGQDGINRLLLEKAKEGKVVVRLKGGDPFVFGRGGEEALFLVENGVEFEVVPGVTSGIAVPAYAGIPVTHRRVSVSVAMVTGHEDPTKGESQINWEHLSTGVDTLVFLMGMGNLDKIVSKLIQFGKDPSTPSAVITWGTRPFQKVLTSVLSELPSAVKREGLKPPGIVVVGEVVGLREKLSWFEKKPLFGKTVVVTRPLESEGNLKGLLEDLGAHVVEFPTISLKKLAFEERAKEILKSSELWDAVIFTSRFGVSLFFRFLKDEGLDGRVFGGKTVVSIGEKTGQELERFFIRPDLIPNEYSSEGILEAFKGGGLSGSGVFLPRAKKGRRELVEGLLSLGCRVFELPLYDTVIPESFPPESLEVVKDGSFDIITFTSSSMVRNFASILEREGVDPGATLSGKVVASIGPVTSDTIRSALGLSPTVEAEVYTMEGLVDAIMGVVG